MNVAYALLILSVAATPGALGAQEAQQLADGPACERCISLDTILRIGTLDGPDALPGVPLSVTVDSSSRYWLLLGFNQAPMTVSAAGDSVTRVGRTGDGPGEFRSPSAAVAVGDSVAIYDPRPGRLTVLDEQLAVTRTVTFFDPVPDQLLAIDWPGAVLAAGAGRGSDIAGWPLHVLDLSGGNAEVLRSMGDRDDSFRPGMSDFHLKHRVAQGSGSSVWSTHLYGKYEISRWSREGEVLERAVRSPAWFPEGSDRLMGSRETPPKPGVIGVHEYRDGGLMAVLKVARPDWRGAWEDTPELPSGIGSVPAGVFPTEFELHQVMIEVIDLERGTVTARTTLPGLPISVLPDGSIAVYGETDIGVPYVDILRATVVER